MKLKIGPGALVAAAFIGPGTVTACTVSGASFGFALIWALVFATFATIILQDMSARLGVMGRMGLGEALVTGAGNPVLKWAAAGLVLAALFVGNAAYEGGNLAGGALGLSAIAGDGAPRREFIWLLAAVAGAFLLYGKYKVLERVLVTLVIIMSLAFTASFFLTRPDFGAMAQGLWPSVPEGGLLRAIALIGTTIVPYNLFLHAAAARDRWAMASEQNLREAQRDTRVSIGLGGLVSIFILATAASTLFGSGLQIGNAADMAAAIEPTFGISAKWLVGIGLLAAGLTSAITAPMATAYAVTEVFGVPEAKRGMVFRSVALLILLIGVALSSLGLKPVELILIAQLANGLLLPIVAVFLLVAMNRASLLGGYVNGWVSNCLGAGVIVFVTALGARAILRALGIWG